VGTDAACADDSTVGPLSVHMYRRVRFWVYPGSMVFGEGVDATPEGFAGDVWGTRAMIEAVVYIFGFPQWWRRWPLFFSRCSTDMATDAAGST
jgi:hypothetical protein